VTARNPSSTSHNKTSLLILPSLLLCLVFFLFPMAISAVAGLWRIDFIDNVYVGLANYRAAFTNMRFMGSLLNGLVYAVLITAGQFGIGIPLGLLVGDQVKKLRKRIQTALYVPGLAGGVIIAALWIWVFHPFNGPLAGIFNIWSNRWTAIAAVSLILVVSGCAGTALTISVLAASVGNEVREAAMMDGARAGQIRRKIILPGISKPVLALIILSMIGATQIWETIQTVSYARPYMSSGSPIWEMYDTGFIQIKYGLACAKTTIYLAVFAVISWIVKRVTK
jgi:ABC-type sugar transport system permease subunit